MCLFIVNINNDIKVNANNNVNTNINMNTKNTMSISKLDIIFSLIVIRKLLPQHDSVTLFSFIITVLV